MMPSPPARAIAMAMSASVTVSIAAETKGMKSGMPRVKRLAVETSRGWTVLWRGAGRAAREGGAEAGRGRDRLGRRRRRHRRALVRCGSLEGLVHHALGRGGDPLHHFAGALDQAGGAGDRLDRDPRGAHGVLDALGDPGKEVGRRGALRVLALEELDEVENLVPAIVGQRLQPPDDPLFELLVHRRLTSLPRSGPAPPPAWPGTWSAPPAPSR